MHEIVKARLEDIKDQFEGILLHFDVKEDAQEYLQGAGWSPGAGAHLLESLIRRQIMRPLADSVLRMLDPPSELIVVLSCDDRRRQLQVEVISLPHLGATETIQH